MITVRDQSFYVAFRPCGCLSACINVEYALSAEVGHKWQASGLTVKQMTGDEMIEMEWGCAESQAPNHHALCVKEQGS